MTVSILPAGASNEATRVGVTASESGLMSCLRGCLPTPHRHRLSASVELRGPAAVPRWPHFQPLT
jgi:hypothetical protein